MNSQTLLSLQQGSPGQSAFNAWNMTHRAAVGGQCDGVVFASCLPAAADIGDFTEVHNASWLRVGNHVLVRKAKQEPLLENKPAAAPGTQVLSLGLQPA